MLLLKYTIFRNKFLYKFDAHQLCGLQYHHKRPHTNQDAAYQRFRGEFLVQEDKGQQRPDRTRKIQLFWLMDLIPPCVFVRNTMPQAIITTTTVRIAVARLEFTPSMPILARMDVSAAKTAEPNANHNHICSSPISIFLKMHVFSPH